jgi:hypothetical protein
MPRVVFDTFAVEVPLGWRDVSDEVEADDPPCTLAHQDGVGALQFSIGLYMSGRIPNPAPLELREMVKDFGRKNSLGMASAVVMESGPPGLAAGSFAWGDDFLRVW